MEVVDTSLGGGYDVEDDTGTVVSTTGIFEPLLLEVESSVSVALFLLLLDSSLSFLRLLLGVVKNVILLCKTIVTVTQHITD